MNEIKAKTEAAVETADWRVTYRHRARIHFLQVWTATDTPVFATIETYGNNKWLCRISPLENMPADDTYHKTLKAAKIYAEATLLPIIMTLKTQGG